MKITIEINSFEELDQIKKLFEVMPVVVKDDETILSLGLTTFTVNCLKNAGITTVKKLLELSDNDLLKIPNLGRKCLSDIKTNLSKNGF